MQISRCQRTWYFDVVEPDRHREGFAQALKLVLDPGGQILPGLHRLDAFEMDGGAIEMEACDLDLDRLSGDDLGRSGAEQLVTRMHRQGLGEVQGREHAEPEGVLACLKLLIPAGFGDEEQGLQVGDADAIVGDGQAVLVHRDVDRAGLGTASVL